MYVEGEGGMHVSTSTLNEELGNVDFILSDKTGTLTKNNMICYGFSMGGYRYLANSIPSKTESKETDHLNRPIIKNKIESVKTKKLSTNKSPGPDGL